MLRGSLLNLAEGNWNALPSLSLFTWVFLCIFPNWSRGTSGFCLSGSGFLGDKFFSLSLMIFGGRIGDLFELAFVDFLFLGGIVCVWVVDFVYIFPLIITLDGSLFVESSLSRVCASVWRVSAKCRFFRCSWNFGQSLGSNWISFCKDLCIYPFDCFVWLSTPSQKQQKHKCSLLYRILLFS